MLVFVREQFKPSAPMLGLIAASVQAGAVVGALAGGWLTDRLGRRVMFMASILLFIVLALARSFTTSVVQLALVRFLLGADVTTGFTHIVEYLPTGRREVMGNRWQVMFAAGQVVCAIVVSLFLVLDISHAMIWRIVLGLGAVSALIIFIMRTELPETAI